jgi:predicted DNA-binding transcriptional regulator AlpA
MSAEKMLTIKEYAASRRISLATYYRGRESGIYPPGEKVGRRAVRISESDAKTYDRRLNQDRVTAVAPAYFNHPENAQWEERAGVCDVSDIEAAASWLAEQASPPQPVIAHIRGVFGLTAMEACQVAARAFELRAAR